MYFLCAMNEGVFPSKKTDTIQKMEEERRLAFVAMTRAQKGCIFLKLKVEILMALRAIRRRFLLDIEPALLDYIQKPAGRFDNRNKRLSCYQRALSC